MQKHKTMKKELMGLMLAAILAMANSASGANNAAYTASGATAPVCNGAITIEAGGVVKCAAGGMQLLSSCSGGIVLDPLGVARCSEESAPPVCTITEGVFGGQKTLTANCLPAATSYIWSDNAGLTSSQSGGVIKPQPIVTTNYTVKGINAAGSGNTATLTVTVVVAAGSAPACSLSASPSTVSSGGSSTLTASCNPAATSYAWTGAGCAGMTSSTCSTGALTSTTSYTVMGRNAAGTGNTARATVTVPTAPPPPPPTTAPPVCTLIGGQFSGQRTLTANCPGATSYIWSANAGLSSSQSGGIINPQPTVTSTYTVSGVNSAGTGTAVPLTITIQAATPSCTLTASPDAIDKDGTSTLTASCSPAATSYAWTGSGCTAETGNTCTVVKLADTTVYTLAGSNAGGTGSPASATVTVAKPSCTVTADPASVAPGGSSVLKANCSPSVGTTYAWEGGACAGVTTLTCNTDALAASTDYTVTASNSLGDSNPASVTVTVAEPSCTLTPSPTLVSRGALSTLEASCTPAATEGYVWTGAGCEAKTGNTCTVTPMTAGTTTYTVTGTNQAGTSTPASATVTAAAPSCTLTALPSTVSPNGASTLTASCSPAPGSYAWSGGTCAGQTTSTCSVTPATTTIYTVAGSDSVGAGNTASATVTMVSDPGCPNGYTYATVPINWPATTDIYVMPVHTMNQCEVRAFQFTMPRRTYGVSRTIYASTPKYISLSQTAYDFSPAAAASGCSAAGYNNPQVRHSTTGDSGARCHVVEGAIYYLNVRNAITADGADVCSPGAMCTFQLSW